MTKADPKTRVTVVVVEDEYVQRRVRPRDRVYGHAREARGIEARGEGFDQFRASSPDRVLFIRLKGVSLGEHELVRGWIGESSTAVGPL